MLSAGLIWYPLYLPMTAEKKEAFQALIKTHVAYLDKTSISSIYKSNFFSASSTDPYNTPSSSTYRRGLQG